MQRRLAAGWEEPDFVPGHGSSTAAYPQLHRAQSLPPGSFPPASRHAASRFDQDGPLRNGPPVFGWRTGRNDPTLMHNDVVKMRLGRDRSEMEPRQAAEFVRHVQHQGRLAERLAEEHVRADLTRNNMGNIDEIVFGRDMDGL